MEITDMRLIDADALIKELDSIIAQDWVVALFEVVVNNQPTVNPLNEVLKELKKQKYGYPSDLDAVNKSIWIVEELIKKYED